MILFFFAGNILADTAIGFRNCKPGLGRDFRRFPVPKITLYLVQNLGRFSISHNGQDRIIGPEILRIVGDHIHADQMLESLFVPFAWPMIGMGTIDQFTKKIIGYKGKIIIITGKACQKLITLFSSLSGSNIG